MGKAQRNKGHDFERDVANDLTKRTGVKVRRNIEQSREGGDDLTIGDVRIECKARKGIASLAFLRQVQNASNPGELPVVVMKADFQKWAVMLTYEDFVSLAQAAGRLGTCQKVGS